MSFHTGRACSKNSGFQQCWKQKKNSKTDGKDSLFNSSQKRDPWWSSWFIPGNICLGHFTGEDLQLVVVTRRVTIPARFTLLFVATRLAEAHLATWNIWGTILSIDWWNNTERWKSSGLKGRLRYGRLKLLVRRQQQRRETSRHHLRAQAGRSCLSWQEIIITTKITHRAAVNSLKL